MKKTLVLFALAACAACGLAADRHVFSMSVKVTALNGELKKPEMRERAAKWMRSHHITKVWLETYRHTEYVPTERLKEHRDWFIKEGFDVCGLLTTTMLNDPSKPGEKPPYVCCWTDPKARARLRDESIRASSIFDTVLLDDFMFTMCTCPRCAAAKKASGKDWPDYRCDVMEDLCREEIEKPSKSANPQSRFMIKFPCWHKGWKNGGLDVKRLTDVFGACWIGTETRNNNPDAMQACWITPWVQKLTGGRCEGCWFDPLDSTPEKYVEQARYTILGGTRETLFHAYDYLVAVDPGPVPFGQSPKGGHECCAALDAEIDGLRKLADLVGTLEPGPMKMMPDGVSRHEFADWDKRYLAFQNTSSNAAPLEVGAGFAQALALPDGAAFDAAKSVLAPHGFVLFVSAGAKTPEEVFKNPPREAHAGVWWHWMGAQVTGEGIAKDLDWMRRMGITSATVFGMCDSCTPWAKRIANVPTDGVRPFSDGWWRLLKFACAEGKRRGIEIGLHNCPGYTSTGGKWIPPPLSMRRLIFNVKDPMRDISTAPDAQFPVYNEDTQRFENPPCEARRTDYQRLDNIRGIEIGHIPMGSFVQPADWDSFGLECDKMNPDAVAFHLDHVIGELKKHLGNDLPAAGLKFVLLDSYEAGTPSWTPRMREEFQKRRGYDCWDYLPIIGGFTNSYTAAECAKFRKDFDRTIKDLYRDVLFKIMAEKLHAEGLAFVNEPYAGPFEPSEVAPVIDRIMTEFWYQPDKPGGIGRGHDRFNTFLRADGRRHNLIEAEAFTGQPQNCHWDETPFTLKACGDRAWIMGVNRFILHSCPTQPWDDDVKPGVTMGRWGTHFGRTQTWAESGKAWFEYVARCQALLQWGEPYKTKLEVPFAQIARHTARHTVYFLVNESNVSAALCLSLPGAWFDPVTGEIGAPPAELLPHQSGFWVTPHYWGKNGQAPQSQYNTCIKIADWAPALGDWTKSADSAAKYFSGTKTYRAVFDCEDASAATEIHLGKVCGATAAVKVNEVSCGIAWCAPWKVSVPAGVLKKSGNVVEVDLTNVWANRLIGDEREPRDVEFAPAPIKGSGEMMLSYPDWFRKGLKDRPSKGRKCFTTWNYFTADSPLVPSGLIGPVQLMVSAKQPVSDQGGRK